jgi:glycosyltransferase involved in cell wall biosynthesis
VVPPTAAAIADALVDFCTQPEKQTHFEAGTRQVKQQFSWEVMVAALKEVARPR